MAEQLLLITRFHDGCNASNQVSGLLANLG
jgi:hypothetical protein